jgi:PAS domain S-box-containing protein
MSLDDSTSTPRRALQEDLPGSRRLIDIEDGHALAQAIVDTIREPLLVLDREMRVVAASRSFYMTFKMDRAEVQGRPVYALGGGQWNIPQLKLLLEKILPRHSVLEAYEVEQDFSGIGRRTMLLNAREIFNESNAHTLILLAIEDITEQRAAERKAADLLQQKDILLQEMQHRVANSLQIIASILLLKARAVQSEETRLHLREAHQRVMSVATLQQQLQGSMHGEPIELRPYLSRLCEALTTSMIGDSRPVSLKMHVRNGTASSGQALSMGLIVTELVINALKHAFDDDKTDGQIIVAYDTVETGWTLMVSDNGIGKPASAPEDSRQGLGTSIVEALAKQIEARVEIASDRRGRAVSIIHATPPSRAGAAT